jgi:hypothetical protein
MSDSLVVDFFFGFGFGAILFGIGCAVIYWRMKGL